jgi:transcriptional regulator with XRE-family HTH domain
MVAVNSPINGSVWNATMPGAHASGMVRRQRMYLREWRKFRNLTQERLADRAGVSQGLISQLENDRTDFTGEVLASLADALACEPADLLIRNPLDDDAIWTIHDQLLKATKQERDQVQRITSALLKTGTE